MDCSAHCSEDGLLHFFLNPEHYPEQTSRVSHEETHISHIFLCDDFVYKVKKPVDFGFLDFSTLRKRRFYCHKEVVLNSRLAQGVYLGVVPIYQKGDAYSFHREKGGRIVEYAVKMKRIPHELILYNLIEEGRPLYGELEEIGKTIALFHHRAAIYRGKRYGGIETITNAARENFEQIRPFCGTMFEERLYNQLVDYTMSFIDEHQHTFPERRKGGYIREGHGDLHSQHICLTRPPVIFDCIEFNEAFRIIDILEDIAFLFMDLEYRGRFDLSARLSKAYSKHQKDDFDKELLRFYKIYRSVVRGKVEGFRAHDVGDEDTKRQGMKTARDYFNLAGYYLNHSHQTFNPVVIMGLSGSGKSTIAKEFSPDWIILRSDAIRKRLSGIRDEEHAYREYGTGIYTEEQTERIYSLLLEEAVKNALEGKRVVVDATYLKSTQRLAFYQRCVEKDLNPFFIHCFACEEVLRERIIKRMAENTDISDAHIETLQRQMEDQEEPAELPYCRVLRLNTEDTLHKTMSALKEFL
ncbi:MAG: AAA family ATPase [Syntrophorhabdaceae bacterium]|nr:AAA family ATPase [Syntrophorhabdaceae bacterium]MDD5243657.1 AAA family ATPase [Syntrophorhabdaceae bacterium]